MAIAPQALGLYGVSYVDWCWVERGTDLNRHNEWDFFYTEVIICIATVFIFSIVGLVRSSQATKHNTNNRQARTKFVRIMFFPLAFLLSYIGGIVTAVNERLGYCPTEGYVIVHSVSFGLQGLFFTVAYIITQNGAFAMLDIVPRQ